VNGQRHDGWDNAFISTDLGFKYLRTRTMIVVDLDGLTQEATAEIVQGSRQGLYEGEVMAAITDRVVATLKRDPDLIRLQAEAEQERSQRSREILISSAFKLRPSKRSLNSRAATRLCDSN
jgi:hypothetical protein